jgi:uracil-DNA glycosylase
MVSLEALLKEIEVEAARAPFPVDTPVYEQVGRDPKVPIAYGGNLEARICSFGRDPGRDEVKYAQPWARRRGRTIRAWKRP